MFSTSSSGVPAGTCVVIVTMYSMASHPPVTGAAVAGNTCRAADVSRKVRPAAADDAQIGTLGCLGVCPGTTSRECHPEVTPIAGDGRGPQRDLAERLHSPSALFGFGG